MILACLAADPSDVTVGWLLFPLSLRDALAIALEFALDTVGSEAGLSVSVFVSVSISVSVCTQGWMDV